MKLAVRETLEEAGGATITNHGAVITIEKGGTTTTVTPQSGGEASMTGGKVVAPENSAVQTDGGPEITIGENGGTAGGDGAIAAP